MKRNNNEHYTVEIKKNKATYTHVCESVDKDTKEKKVEQKESNISDVLNKVAEINRKSALVGNLKSTLFMLFCAFAVIAIFYSLWFLIGSLVMSIVLLLLPKDTKVALQYTMDQVSIDTYTKRLQAMKTLGGMSNIWSTNPKTKKLVQAVVTIEGTLFVSNISIVTISTENGAYIFLPDTIIMINNNTVVTADYENISFAMDKVDVVAEKKIPADAKIVGYKWKYIDENGNRDTTKPNNVEYKMLGYATVSLLVNNQPVLVLTVSSRQKATTFMNKLNKI